MLNAFVAVTAGFTESVTWTVKLEVPPTVGVPEMTPEALLRERPFGRRPLAIDQV
jgi:hypothetical protein